MANFEEILSDILKRHGNGSGKTVAWLAGKMGTDATRLSRIKNGKAPISDKIISEISSFLGKDETEDGKKFAIGVEQKLLDLKSRSAKEKPSQDHRSERYSIADAEILFDSMAAPGSVMCTDYRDMPQLARAGAYPTLSSKIANAMNEGLCIGLFQPFGTLESLRETHNKISLNTNFRDLTILQKSYMFLTELADNVRKVYERIKENVSPDMKGQIRLYEAQIENPMITAIGMQSRVLLTSYIKNEQRYEQIHEWVAGADEQYFIERSQISLSLDALKLQFYPVYNFWEEKGSLPGGEELENYYKESGGKGSTLAKILGKSMVKWKSFEP